MAVALEAIKGFLHFFTDDSSSYDDDPRHIVTILDVLKPRGPQNRG
jgi:hypothetical protein